jgi:hypothetical protein
MAVTCPKNLQMCVFHPVTGETLTPPVTRNAVFHSTGPTPTAKRFTMYVKAQIVRVAATTDKCSCGGTMTVRTTVE